MKKGRKIFLIGIGMLLSLANTLAAFAEDYSVLGTYVKNGYENEYFGYRIELPSDYELVTRSILQSVDKSMERTIEDSNSESTLSWLNSSLNLSSAKVFEAQSDTDYMCVSVETPGFMKDYWDEEETIAKNTAEEVEKNLSSSNESVTVSGVSTTVDYLDDFIDGKHYAISYKCLLNDVPYYGIEIIVRSKDKNYISIFEFASFDADHIEVMCDYCSKL